MCAEPAHLFGHPQGSPEAEIWGEEGWEPITSPCPTLAPARSPDVPAQDERRNRRERFPTGNIKAVSTSN